MCGPLGHRITTVLTGSMDSANNWKFYNMPELHVKVCLETMMAKGCVITGGYGEQA